MKTISLKKLWAIKAARLTFVLFCLNVSIATLNLVTGLNALFSGNTGIGLFNVSIAAMLGFLSYTNIQTMRTHLEIKKVQDETNALLDALEQEIKNGRRSEARISSHHLN